MCQVKAVVVLPSEIKSSIRTVSRRGNSSSQWHCCIPPLTTCGVNNVPNQASGSVILTHHLNLLNQPSVGPVRFSVSVTLTCFHPLIRETRLLRCPDCKPIAASDIRFQLKIVETKLKSSPGCCFRAAWFNRIVSLEEGGGGWCELCVPVGLKQ